MNALPARSTAAPPLRPLAGLTGAVVLVHVLLLQAAPVQWGMADQPASKLRPLLTRTIEIKPPAALAATPAPSPPLRRTAPSRPRSPENTAPAPILQGQAAIESIASPAPEQAVASPPAPATVPEPSAPVAAATALSIPGSVRLNYNATGRRSRNIDYQAKAWLDWRQDGAAYEARMVVSDFLMGTRTMASSGRITGDGLAPTRFLDKYRSERAAHFQPEKGKITFSTNAPDVPWLTGAQDRISVFVQLASLLAGDPAKYPAGSSISLYTAGPSGADTWTFVVGPEEKLSLPAGEISTLKLTRKPQRDYDYTIEVWLAPSLAWLPVRTRITQHNGDFVDQQLRSTEKPS